MSDVAFYLGSSPKQATSLVKDGSTRLPNTSNQKTSRRFTFVETRLKSTQAESADHANFRLYRFPCQFVWASWTAGLYPFQTYTLSPPPRAAQSSCRMSLTLPFSPRFDYYLSKALSPPGDFLALTRLVQAAIRKRYYGFAPPGSCILVPGLPPNDFACKTIAVCPTMRYPENITWHKDIVYNTMWSLLVELEHWNKRVSVEDRINRVVMSGLGTGAGRIPATECARQMALAVKHFLYGRREEGDGEEDIFSWDKALGLAEEV
ncbi:hypothetical protein JVT61DRAFT_12573 [Boletus reticuloceps]|uniref:Macro domain-like protein n=1 Tax=Boletus reticuloceps TaxID=495285 RepID=A0A8I2YDT0_9AGAM|nr:hypothetical protein JVT61DRAFT_12573 [Boletus reticuloceps]